MTDLTTLRSLQQRIREATGADRKLDWDIAFAFQTYTGFDHKVGKAIAAYYTSDPGGLGACVALLGAVLPGAEFELSTIYGLAHVNLPLNPADHETMQFVRREDGNKCLAFCEAIIAAVIAKEEAKEAVTP